RSFMLWEGSPGTDWIASPAPIATAEVGDEGSYPTPLDPSRLAVVLVSEIVILHLDLPRRSLIEITRIAHSNPAIREASDVSIAQIPDPEDHLLIAAGPFLSRCNWRTGERLWTQRLTAGRISHIVSLVP